MPTSVPSRWRARQGLRFVVVLGTALALVACSAGEDRSAEPDPAPTASVSTTTMPVTTTTAAPTTTTTAPTTTTTEAPPPLPRIDLRSGDEGPDVTSLQRRLTELRYWVGPLDGQYGHLVQQGMYAFEKATGRPVDGVLDAADRLALTTATPVLPQSPAGSGSLIEVDKSRQLLLLVEDGSVVWAFNAASGTEQPYLHPADGPSIADTPVGSHQVLFGKDELEDGKLGRLYRPRYFHADAIAIHGDASVPPAPASHGCVRISIPAMDMFWAQDLAPVGKPVIVYGTSPPPWPGAA